MEMTQNDFGDSIELDGHIVQLHAKTLPHVHIYANKEIAFAVDPTDGLYRERWRKGRIPFKTWLNIFVDGLLDGSEK